MKCELCQKEFTRLAVHLQRHHKIKDLKHYYDCHIKIDGEGVCIECGGITNFCGIKGGYCKYCSVKCSSVSDLIKNKKTYTCMKNRGTKYPTQSKYVIKKRIETFNRNFGVDHPMKLKKIRQKFKRAIRIKYGVDSPLQSKEIKDKIKQTCLKHFGVEYAFQSQYVKNKIVNTMIEKYGVDQSSKSKIIQQRKINTSLKRYGVENPFQFKEIKEKIKRTMIKKYGFDNYFKTSIGRKICRINAIRMVENQKLNGEPLGPRIGDFERPCLNELQKITQNQIQRNPQIIGYFPDGYIKELNIVIEFDERHHFKDNYITYIDRDIKKNQDYLNAGFAVFRIKKIDWDDNKRPIIQKFRERIAELESKIETSSAKVN